MKKEEKIKEAWGYAWDFIDGHVKENALYYGWVHKLNINIHFNELNIELQQHYTDEWLYRPKSLQGIEDNNGWIKIENEEDLPKEKALYFIANSNPDIIFYSSNMISDLDNLKEMWEDGDITHYQPIEKPKPPIY